MQLNKQHTKTTPGNERTFTLNYFDTGTSL